MQLTEEQLLAAYKRMRDIREFEDRLMKKIPMVIFQALFTYIAEKKL